MSPKSLTTKPPAEAVVRDIRRATRRHYSAEDKFHTRSGFEGRSCSASGPPSR